MKTNTKVIALCLGLITLITVNSSYFVLPEATQAVVTQFGNPKAQLTTSGVHLKVPFIQEVRLVDKRILSWDGFPNQVPTKDKKYISVDTTARWQVIDALKFMQTVQNEQGAYSRLNTILDSATRSVIASHNLVEAVRNTNDIITRMEEKKKENKDAIDEEVYSDIERVEHGREKLSIQIKELSEKELSHLGIKLVDVQFRRISYEKSVEIKVFERMISERQRIAAKIRSIGLGESAKIHGKMQKDLSKIESESYKRVQEIKGDADAKAMKVYAQAFSKNSELFEFLKSMEGYKKVFGDEKELVISPESNYFKYLKGVN